MATPIVSYCTLPDLLTYGVQQSAIRSIAVDIQAAAIEAQSRVIDSYLRSHYILPLTQVGKDIARACAILTVYDLLATRGFSPEGDADQVLQTRYDATIRWLEQVAAGRAFPDITDSSPDAVPGKAPQSARVVTATSRGWSNRGTREPGGGFTID